MKKLLFIVFNIVLLNTSTVVADVYKCVSEDGRKYYSNTVCPSGTQKELEVKSGDKYRPESKSESYSSDTAITYPKESFKKINLNIETISFSLSGSDRYFLEVGTNFIHDYFSNVFEFDDTVEIKIKIFGNESSFFGYQKNVLNGLISKTGFYTSRVNEAVINGQREKSKVLSTTLHESSHAILDTKVPWLPLWLHEGLAEYFEGIVPQDKNKIVIRNQNARHIELRLWIASGNLPPLKDYLKLNNHGWREKGQAHNEITRTMAWSLVHFLMSSKRGQKTMVKILNQYKDNSYSNPYRVVNKSYPGGLTRLEQDWLKYIESPPTIHSYKGGSKK